MKKIKKHIKYQKYLIPMCNAQESIIQLPTTCNKIVSPKCIQCPMVAFQELKVPLREKIRRLC